MVVKGGGCEEGLPEWVMSFADMVTILMAFFVVMYSTAGEKDSQKSRDVIRSLRQWMTGVHYPWPGTGETSPAIGAASNAKDRQAHRGHASVHVTTAKNSFATGGSLRLAWNAQKFTRDDEKRLREIAEVLAGKSNIIEIRGQSGRRPLSKQAEYRDTMDLAHEKCRLVMEALSVLGIERERMQIRVLHSAQARADENRTTNADCWLDVFLLDEFYRPSSGG